MKLDMKQIEYVCKTFGCNLRMNRGDYEKAYNLTVAQLVGEIVRNR